jgi:hypothetical protein
MRRPPKFVQGFIDRHGKPRFYFRRAGFKRVPLPGLPWSPEFMASYETALAGQPAPIGASKIKAGTVRALAVSYFGSTAFLSLKPATQRHTRNAIEKFCRQHGDKARRHCSVSTSSSSWRGSRPSLRLRMNCGPAFAL